MLDKTSVLGLALLVIALAGCGSEAPENKRTTELFRADVGVSEAQAAATGTEFEQIPRGPAGDATGIAEAVGNGGDYNLMVRLANATQFYNITAGDTNFCADGRGTDLIVQFESRVNTENTLAWPNRFIKIEPLAGGLKILFESDTSYGDDACASGNCNPDDIEYRLRCPNPISVAAP